MTRETSANVENMESLHSGGSRQKQKAVKSQEVVFKLNRFRPVCYRLQRYEKLTRISRFFSDDNARLVHPVTFYAFLRRKSEAMHHARKVQFSVKCSNRSVG